MSQNKLNPNNSSIIQMLLDLNSITIQSGDDETFELCNKLLNKLNSNYSLQKKVDEKYNNHKYNEQNMTFSKLENFRNLKIINNLSSNSVKILFLIIQTVSQDNLVEIRISTLMDILKMSKPTVTKCLLELVESGAISKMQNRNKTQGTIYMLNPKVASCGKHTHNKIYENITQESYLSTFEELNNINYSILTCKGYISINEKENKYLTYNSLTELYDEDLSDWGLV